MQERVTEFPIIGWREWASLPDLGIERLKVKVDSGARSSSLHAFDIVEYERDGANWVRFRVHPLQRNTEFSVEADVRVLETRSVRSSSGEVSLRPVILTNVTLLGTTWQVELTLANREEMKFRMLLGREAFRGRFLVDGGRSYYGGRPLRRRVKKQQ